MIKRTSNSYVTWLGVPLIAFAALLVVLGLVNRTPAPSTGTGADSDPAASTDTRALIADLRETLAADPDNGQAAVGLGNAYYQRSRETGDGRFYELADRAYAAAVDLPSMRAPALAGQATIALANHQFADGLTLARRAHRTQPGLLAPYPALVDGLIETGRYAEAAQALERMVTLKPNLAAYSRISYYRELHGDLPGAAQALRLAISAGAGTIEGTAYIRSLLGDLQATRGRYGAASHAYREALFIDPGYRRAEIGLALLRAGGGELGGAITTIRAQLGEAPSPDVLMTLGEVEQAAGRTAAARRHYAQASELEAQGLREGAGYDAGVTLNEAEHGDSALAVSYGRRAWRSAPSVSSADAYSWALYRDGRIGHAERLSAEAMRLGSRDPEFGFHAGMIAAAAGHEGRAARLLSTLLERTPRFNTLYAPQAERTLRGLR